METRKKNKFFLALSLAGQLGFSFLTPLFLSLWLGYFLDKKFSLTPWGFLGGLILGLVAGGYAIFSLIRPFLAISSQKGYNKEKLNFKKK